MNNKSKMLAVLMVILLMSAIGCAAFANENTEAEDSGTEIESTEETESASNSVSTVESKVIALQIGNPMMSVNGQEQPIDERGTVPVIQNSNTLLPVRVIVEAMGGNVGWDGTTRTVTLTRGGDIIRMTIESPTAYLNDRPQTLDTAPELINSVTMLPIRFIAENFGFRVDWDGAEQRVTITGSALPDMMPAPSERLNGKQDAVSLTSMEEITELESGLSAVRFDGEYGFDAFLEQGGASSDSDVIAFLMNSVFSEAAGISFNGDGFGCSTISVKSPEGDSLFGRNFDWNHCSAMIVQSTPSNGYASISTVNTDFISGVGLTQLPDQMQAITSLYAPLDGMNEKGLVVSVNMIQDNATINQDTDKPDITTTTAIRMLLNQAATVDEAIDLLEAYDMHAPMGYMVHFAIADTDENNVVVEYVNNEMIVTETPVVTNFYLAEGEKNGIGTSQSHTRYDILMELLDKNATMSMTDVRDALSSVSKQNFGEFESTEWSIVFNQSTGEVWYYHRENYEDSYVFSIESR